MKSNSFLINQDSGEKTWLTPPSIITALGEFDLDPCCPPKMPWRTAKEMVCRPNDGLAVDWNGKRVWCNPPYGKEAKAFVEKMVEHSGGGILLVFARTENRVWQDLIFPNAHSVMFVRGRVNFYNAGGSESGTAPTPSALVAFSEHDTDALRNSGIAGFIVKGGKTND